MTRIKIIDRADMNTEQAKVHDAAKENGGNDYRFFTEEMNRKALHRMKLESSLRKALNQKIIPMK
mgnify:CR=1 FL=1